MGCIGKNWDNQNGDCVKSCSGNECRYDPSKRCGSTWAYYISGSTRYCLGVGVMSCSGSWPYRMNDRQPYQCVSSCPAYAQNNKCQNSCTGSYAQPVSGKICSTTCAYYMSGSSRICVQAGNQCTGSYQYYQTQSNPPQCSSSCLYYTANNKKICTSSCPSGYKYKINTTTPNQCVSSCPTNQPYINTGNICTASCPNYIIGNECKANCSTGEYAQPYTGQVCSNTCAYRLSGSNKICVSDQSSCPVSATYKYTVSITNNRAQCTDTTTYVNNVNGVLYAVSSCPDYASYVYQQVQPYQCSSDCSGFGDYKYINSGSNVCSTSCNSGSSIPITGCVCSTSCLFYQDNNNIRRCTATCPSSYPFQITQTTPNQCVSSCSQVEGYPLQNTFTNPQSCVSSCPDEHKYIQNSSCQNGCTGPYANPVGQYNCTDTSCMYQIENNYWKCVSSCQSPYSYQVTESSRSHCTQDCSTESVYKYTQGTVCVQNCQGEYANPQSGNVCDQTCQYRTNSNGIKICMENCTSPAPYHVNTTREQCVASCSEVPPYIYLNLFECQDSCEPPTAYPEDSGNVSCSLSCRYYTSNNKRYCMEECSGQYKYYFNDTTPTQCVSDCNSSYVQQSSCVQSCSGVYAQPITGYFCDDSCKYYTQDTLKYCTQDCNAPNYLIVQVSGVRTHCTSSCSLENSMYQDPGTIPEGCQKNCGNCVAGCTGAQAMNQTTNTCDSDCPYYQSGTDLICTEQCTSPYNYNYTANGRTQCVQQCSTTPYFYIQENNCVQQCDFEAGYAVQSSNYACDDQCNWYQQDSIRICTLTCSGLNPYKFITPGQNKYQCVSNCSQTTTHLYLQEDTCVEKCAQPYATPTTGAGQQCSQTCTYKIVDQLYYCVDSCSGEGLKKMNASRPYCVSECGQQYQYVIEQDNEDICTQECTNNFARPVQGNQCDDQCLYYQNQSYKECVESCNSKDLYYVQSVRDYCVESCQDAQILFNYYNESKGEYICSSSCPQGYAQPASGSTDNECSLNCTYYTFQNQDYCVQTCPGSYPYMEMIGDRIKCIDSCDINSYIENQYCVDSCTIPNANPIDGRTCSSVCQFEDHETYYQCVVQCTGDYNLIVTIDSRDQCVQTCPDNYYQVPDIIRQYCINNCSQTQYQYIQERFCVGECSEEYELLSNECISPNTNQQPQNNNLKLVLGITIPVIVVVIIITVIAVYICKRQRKTTNKKIVNNFINDKNNSNKKNKKMKTKKSKHNNKKQVLNTEQQLTGIVKTSNLKPITINNQNNSIKQHNNQLKQQLKNQEIEQNLIKI